MVVRCVSIDQITYVDENWVLNERLVKTPHQLKGKK